MKKRISIFTALLMLDWTSSAQAHHSFAMFDNQKQVTVDGTVKEFQWTNPHCWIDLVSRDASGQEVEWSIEGSSPNNLVRMGWKRNTIKSGDHVTIVIHPLKDGSNGGSLIGGSVNGQAVVPEDKPAA